MNVFEIRGRIKLTNPVGAGLATDGLHVGSSGSIEGLDVGGGPSTPSNSSAVDDGVGSTLGFCVDTSLCFTAA